MRRTLTAAICTLVGWSVYAPHALAQAGPGTLSPGAGALVVEKPIEQAPVLAPQPVAPMLAPTVGTDQAAPAVVLRQVKLAGQNRLGSKLDAAVAAYIGKPLGADTIKGAADAVSRAYADTGLAFYTVAVPNQNLAGGVLTLRMVEGFISEVTITGSVPASRNRLVRAYAARLRRQRPLTRATLERYMSRISDI